jgi:hypothetical protein
MAKQAREEARAERETSRERRRSVAPPLEDGSDPVATAKQAARTAAGAAIAGGLAGAAKALLDRRGRSDERDEDEDRGEQREQSEHRDQPEPETHEHDDPKASVADDGEQDEPASRSRTEEPARGASSSDVAATVKRARQHITDLLGKEPESISGVQHVDGSWSVKVEIVEVHRIPDTTDILCSYEVVLDDDGDLVRLERQRRYRRSQVEED